MLLLCCHDIWYKGSVDLLNLNNLFNHLIKINFCGCDLILMCICVFIIFVCETVNEL
jgi:hypothetical protein